MSMSLDDLFYEVRITKCTQETSFNYIILKSLITYSRGNFRLNSKYTRAFNKNWYCYAVEYVINDNGWLSFQFMFNQNGLACITRYCNFTKQNYLHISFGNYQSHSYKYEPNDTVDTNRFENCSVADKINAFESLRIKEDVPAKLALPIQSKALELEKKPEPVVVKEEPVVVKEEPVVVKEEPIPEATIVYDCDNDIDKLSDYTPKSNEVKISLNQILKVRKVSDKTSKSKIEHIARGIQLKTQNNVRTLLIDGITSKLTKRIEENKINMDTINYFEISNLDRVNKKSVLFTYNNKMWKCPCGGRGANLNSLSLHFQSKSHYCYDNDL